VGPGAVEAPFPTDRGYSFETVERDGTVVTAIWR
jgi:hypothetical protein